MTCDAVQSPILQLGYDSENRYHFISDNLIHKHGYNAIFIWDIFLHPAIERDVGRITRNGSVIKTQETRLVADAHKIDDRVRVTLFQYYSGISA